MTNLPCAWRRTGNIRLMQISRQILQSQPSGGLAFSICINVLSAPFSHSLHPVYPEFLSSLKMFLHSCVPECVLWVVLLLMTLLKCYQSGAQALCWPSGSPAPLQGTPGEFAKHVLSGAWETNIAHAERPCKSAATHRCFNKLDEWLIKAFGLLLCSGGALA